VTANIEVMYLGDNIHGKIPKCEELTGRCMLFDSFSNYAVLKP
jgi:hypothetical protein